MFFSDPRIHQYIINIHDHKLIKLLMLNRVHEGHELQWGVA
jgi:predicted acetyltransferase